MLRLQLEFREALLMAIYRHGHTKLQAADALTIHHNTINNWLFAGARPSDVSLEMVINYCNEVNIALRKYRKSMRSC